MSGSLDRGLAILELLAQHGGPMALSEIAERTGIPPSATHRLLSMLGDLAYVRQDADHSGYRLGLKLVSLALINLSVNGVVNVAQPTLDQLARKSGELVRLGVIEGEHLVFVAKAQGARQGLRYDPDMGKEAPLFCTASGQAWLSCLTDEQALMIVSPKGFGEPGDFGPNAPRTIKAFLRDLHAARERGYSMVVESYEPGMSAIGIAIHHPVSGEPIGALSIAGPHTRFTKDRMVEVVPALLAAARELSATCLGSSSFRLAAPDPGR